jgi:uncharacterized protein (UPF0332 family)
VKKPQFHEEIQANLERADQAIAMAAMFLSELRGLGDYGVTGHVPQEEARQAIQVAGEFVVQVKLFLDTQDISSS